MRKIKNSIFDINDSDLWDGYMAAISFEAFMEDVNSTVEEAVKDKMDNGTQRSR